jgi:predicted methyltransferase
MTRRLSIASTLVSAFVAFGCGGAAEPAPAPVAPPPPVTTAPPIAATPPPEPAKAAEPTPEEKKKAEDARALREERAKWEEDHKAELARWTPELHSEAKALAEKTYPSGKAAITATVAGKHRKPGMSERDKYRHPVETLEFFGFKPNMTVVDVGPGEGYYTELLAPALAKSGKYVGTSGDPNGPPEARSTFYAQRFKGILDKSPEAYGKAQTVVLDPKAPKLGMDGKVDIVLIMRGLHGMKTNGTLSGWLAEIHRALKPNGVLGIEEHRAAEGANVDDVAKKGYLPEKWVISEIEAVGFKLAGKSEINANPKDTKDWPEGVWTLPPTLRLKDQDRAKYVAIGESDRMTLKFVKVAAKPASKK